MKKIFNIPTIVLLLIGTIYFASCEKVYDGTYDRYEPVPITNENVNLKYETLVTYPVPDVLIESKAPTYDAEGPVDFGIDTVIAVSDSKFQIGKFNVDRTKGVVKYDNKGGTIYPGEYHVSVSILNVNGLAIINSAYTLTILDVPIKVTPEPEKPNAEFLYSGAVSTLSWDAIDVDENTLGKVSFSISPEVPGFTIDKNDIVKDLTAKPGIHKITVVTTTDLGEKEFKDLVTVTVGEEPTLKYLQQNGTDSLGKVTLSPWTGYTTAAPELKGMTSEGWEIILPESAPQQLADALSADANGSVVVAPDMNIPVGDYLIGVKVGYAGDFVQFKNLFTLHVETRWDESTPVVSEHFQDDSGNPALTGETFSVHLFGAADPAKFKAALQTSDNASMNKLWDVRVAKLIGGKHTPALKIDALMVIPVNLTASPDIRNLRVKFASALGFGNNALNLYQRTFAYTYTALNDDDDIPADWKVIMEADDAEWPSGINWGKGYYYDDFLNNFPTGITEAINYLPQTSSFHETGAVDYTKTIYLCWRVTGTDVDNKNSIFLFDDITVQAAKSFAAEEE